MIQWGGVEGRLWDKEVDWVCIEWRRADLLCAHDNDEEGMA